MKILKYLTVSVLASVLVLSSCSDEFTNVKNTAYLDANTAAEIAASDPDALDSYLLGAFSYLVQFDVSGNSAHDDFSHMSVLHSTDMMGNDIAMSASHWFNYDYQHDNHEFNYRRTLVDWTTYYTTIAKANEIISFFPEEPADVQAKGLMAHGYALRAFAYYYLIQLYQHPVTASGDVNWDAPGVPMYFSSVDGYSLEEQETFKGRNTVRAVYEQIEKDLLKAVGLFEQGYTRPTKNYMNASVANGLLARYYLLSQQWDKAVSAAQKAYASYTLDAKLSNAFNDITHSEWMWGFDHNAETQTTYASFFSHVSNLTGGYAGLAYASRLIDSKLYDAIPETDIRKSFFNGPQGDATQSQAGAKLPYAGLKFGWLDGWVMDYMYMRAPEMYLIEAEALAHLNQGEKAAEALAPLMAVRDKGWHKSSVTVEDVYLQRRIELWGEGFSFFDLKRLNKGIDRAYAGNNHLPGYQLVVPALAKTWIYQIPNKEMQENKALTEDDQNE